MTELLLFPIQDQSVWSISELHRMTDQFSATERWLQCHLLSTPQTFPEHIVTFHTLQ